MDSPFPKGTICLNAKPGELPGAAAGEGAAVRLPSPEQGGGSSVCTATPTCAPSSCQQGAAWMTTAVEARWHRSHTREGTRGSRGEGQG